MNDVYESNLKSKCDLLSKELISSLDESIEDMKKRHAANGLLKSGNTIKFVMDEIEAISSRFYEELFETIKNSKLKFNPNLEGDIFHIVTGKFSEFIEVAYGRLAACCTIVGKPELYKQMRPKVEEAVERESSRFDSKVRHYVLGLKSDASSSKISRFLGISEIVTLIVIAFLSGLWANDPGGNYEPFIVFLGILLSGLEIWRRKIT